ncbi:hypothetical protein GCM10008018_10000 [Paenibacillus marchantiophytorum]|uniref:DUF4871 domain-containing protein n=1 Tax=Paenibacillus marchantiophytorum TaxID=1619310 RepID=A0ABQ2BS65_9BACL|nr:DUF4871 domain-containing protein [Paenibacillus marchantiophytorum]GGI45019.1 hypothetical protein GCM10008018_10000 [Paenibacillus marchantiophytorum]
MSGKKPVWAEEMAESPFTDRHFTMKLKNKVIHRVSETRRDNRRIYKVVAAALTLAIVLLIGGLSGKIEEAFTVGTGFLNTHKAKVSLSERKEYYDHGRLLFSIAPQPNARAGETNGYILHFEAPMETFIGKIMVIQAVHLQSGSQETISSDKIATPSNGYPGLDRYALRFALPLEGMWRIDVLLDEKMYGNVTVYLDSPLWEISPQFVSDNYFMRGTEQKIGFIDAGFIAGNEQKYMWHFWGNEDQLNGPFQIKAVKEGSDNIIDVFSSNPLASSNALAGELNGADRHAPTLMMLPEVGRWRLLPYVHGRLLDPIVVEVK